MLFHFVKYFFVLFWLDNIGMLKGTAMQCICSFVLYFRRVGIWMLIWKCSVTLITSCKTNFYFQMPCFNGEFFFFSISVSICWSCLNILRKKSLRTDFLWHYIVEPMDIQWHNEMGQHFWLLMCNSSCQK